MSGTMTSRTKKQLENCGVPKVCGIIAGCVSVLNLHEPLSRPSGDVISILSNGDEALQYLRRCTTCSLSHLFVCI
ncbi:hypothetical protein AVEN_24591-1 [Araneus ventricosus]|uniref:Uncharacterized protein n=1 Tax=Araneus ventricosus TaxID=182803 RepID=A0A4Y2FDX1_ARAVE|nr:hypothetical protein AVEN_24591-1 [Araneus ventricosus]